MKRPRNSRSLAILLLGRFLALIFRLYAATWRTFGMADFLTTTNRLQITPLLVGFWHGRYLPLFVLLRNTPAHVLIAEGLRGELIREISIAFGFIPVMLPRHDRPRAISKIRDALNSGLPCASSLDGALGPPETVKRALVQIASDIGATILPISAASRPRVCLSWRWDQRELPLPFAKVELRTGPSIAIPKQLSPAGVDQWCARVEGSLSTLEAPRIDRHRIATSQSLF